MYLGRALKVRVAIVDVVGPTFEGSKKMCMYIYICQWRNLGMYMASVCYVFSSHFILAVVGPKFAGSSSPFGCSSPFRVAHLDVVRPIWM